LFQKCVSRDVVAAPGVPGGETLSAITLDYECVGTPMRVVPGRAKRNAAGHEAAPQRPLKSIISPVAETDA